MAGSDPGYWLKLVEKATPDRGFRGPGPGPGAKPIDGPALARRRRDHRKAYQARNQPPRLFGMQLDLPFMLIGIPVVVLFVVFLCAAVAYQVSRLVR